MAELPRFNQPFSREGSPISPTGSPPQTPRFSPRLLSFSKLPKRLSLSLSSEASRKGSVASFHGDLITEKNNRQRKKIAWKALTFFALFTLGLLSGIAIGCWAIPHYLDSQSVSVSKSSPPTSIFEDSDSTLHGLNIQARATRSSTSSTARTSSTKVATSSTKAGASSTKAVAPAATQVKIASSSTATAATSVASSSSSGTAVVASSYWKPTAGTTFQIQLSSVMKSTTNLPANVSVYDIDLFDTPATTIAALQAAGKKVICYFSAGTSETWRPDYASFTSADIGGAMDGWEGENWLNTASTNVRNIMAARIKLAKTKGCDGVDPDNMDVYEFPSDSGFSSLSTTTATNYMQFLSTTAHDLGLAVGLKNAGEIINNVISFVDFSVSESCVQYKECTLYQPFIAAGKPAFAIQYPFGENDQSTTTVSSTVKSKQCTGSATIAGLSNVLKHYNLDAWTYAC